ncbi:MAG: hypothetical protein ACOC4R_02080 [Bacteroidota bacterium]
MYKEDTSLPPSEGTGNTEKRSNAGKNSSALLRFVKKQPVFTTIVIALILMTAGYFWMDLRAHSQYQQVKREAALQVEQNTQDMLKLFTRPLVWSIRAEMLRGNKEQVDLLISDIVKEDNFRHIMVVDAEGEILSSTNKRQEGQMAEDYLEAEMLAMDTTTIVQGDDGTTLASFSPILGFDRRIGTLVIEYTPEEFTISPR